MSSTHRLVWTNHGHVLRFSHRHQRQHSGRLPTYPQLLIWAVTKVHPAIGHVVACLLTFPNSNPSLKLKQTPVMSTQTLISTRERPGRKRKHSYPKTSSTRRRKSSDSESERVELDSDALDESDDVQPKRKKPKRTVPSPSKSKRTPKRRSKKDSESSEEERPELQDGQEIVGHVVKAPTTGLGMPFSLTCVSLFILTCLVPAGLISHNTLSFLTKLKDPECNDRQWYEPR